MTKIKKEDLIKKQEQIAQQRMERSLLKRSMFASAIVTYIIAAGLLVLSILMNWALPHAVGAPIIHIIEIPNPDGETWLKVVDVLLRGGLIILFFFFMMVSWGNIKELRGYILTWKEMVVLIILSLFQTIIEGWALLTATLGIIIIIVYLYFIQGKIAAQ